MAKRNGSTLIQYRVEQPGIRGEVHEVLSYNASNQSVQVFTYARPNIFSYATGRVSSDCRHISLSSHANNFSTRRSRVNFVRR
ncbi:MAG: hypothetical protein P8009_09155 [Gammaproteobacteria bacterium]